MARYETIIPSPMSQVEAFDYMADLRNFEEWDPGVKASKQSVGSGPAPGAEYDLELTAMSLRYVMTEFDRPHRAKVEAHSSLLSSFDLIEITETSTGSLVRYEAVIQLRTPLKLIDPLFGLVFNRIGDKAADGMKEALSESRIS